MATPAPNSLADKANAVGYDPAYIVDGDPGRAGGGTYTAPADEKRDPTLEDWENIFGPAGRDVKLDLQRHKRYSRWHLPDVLKGPNPYLADKIDGLITDTTASPFTTKLLPYTYLENVDGKISWNRWNFDEGLASRVPYESAARTLVQSKTSYEGYTVRQGLAITMEHNFMMSEKGRQNFQNQLRQVTGSIQYTNDIDVHMALISAQSYAKERAEKFFMSNRTNHQVLRQYIDLFGACQKNPNSLDIIIEEARAVLESWGSPAPDFLLTNSKLTFQMQMTPENTQYLTQGPEGIRRLKQGPKINNYRGLSIINSRSFSLEDGAPPRDVLRRRVRVAEYYRIPWEPGCEKKYYSFYDENKDSWQKFSWHDLFRMAECPANEDGLGDDPDQYDADQGDVVLRLPGYLGGFPSAGKSVQAPAAGVGDGAAVQMGPLDLPRGYTVPRGTWNEMKQAIVGLGRVPDFMGPIVGLNNELKLVDYVFKYGSTTSGPQMNPANVLNTDEMFEEHTRIWGHTENDEEGVENYKHFLSDVLDFIRGNVSNLPIPQRSWLESIPWTGGRPDGGFLNTFLTVLFNKDIELQRTQPDRWELVIVRPNIEHSMLGVVIGRGGLELGATFWGQTELSVYDDSLHGIWGMSYKYNERALVYNNKLMTRFWDIAYDGYEGGKDCTYVKWTDQEHLREYHDRTYELGRPYEGPSMLVMRFNRVDNTEPFPSPIVFHDSLAARNGNETTYLDGEHQHAVRRDEFRIFNRKSYNEQYKRYYARMPEFSRIHNPKNAGTASSENETSCNTLAFQGTMIIHEVDNEGNLNGQRTEISGNGHHGPDFVGVASVRCGKGISMGAATKMGITRIA